MTRGLGWEIRLGLVGCFPTEATLSLERIHTGRGRRRRGHSPACISASHSTVYKVLLLSVSPLLREASRSGLPFSFRRRGKLRPTEAH